jgi:hypothetical protein
MHIKNCTVLFSNGLLLWIIRKITEVWIVFYPIGMSMGGGETGQAVSLIDGF